MRCTILMSSPQRSGLRALDARDLALLAAATTLVVAVRATLWLLPSRAIVRGVRRLAHARGPEAPRADAMRVVWAVEAASRRVPRASCLTQALAALLFLRACGWHAQLCVGVARRDADGFRAHAWLEREGRILIGGTGVRQFTRLPDLAATGNARWT